MVGTSAERRVWGQVGAGGGKRQKGGTLRATLSRAPRPHGPRFPHPRARARRVDPGPPRPILVAGVGMGEERTLSQCLPSLFKPMLQEELPTRSASLAVRLPRNSVQELPQKRSPPLSHINTGSQCHQGQMPLWCEREPFVWFPKNPGPGDLEAVATAECTVSLSRARFCLGRSP